MPSPRSPRIRIVVAATLVAVVVAACSTTPEPAASPSAAAPSPSAVAPSAVAPSAIAPSAANPSVTPGPSDRVEVTLTDTFRIEPASMAVPVGVPVTFVVTNAGVLPHEFYLGDEAAQADHETEMAMGGMAHDDPEGIGVDPGETRELTFTFETAGAMLAGCHVPGHYAAGMLAAITVVP